MYLMDIKWAKYSCMFVSVFEPHYSSLNIHYTLNPELNVSVFELTLLVHKKQPLPQSPGWVLYPALSLILASPEFKTQYIRHNDRLTSQKQEDIETWSQAQPVCGRFLCGWGSWAGLCLWVSSISCRTTAVRHVQLVPTPDSNWPKTSPDSSERQTWKHSTDVSTDLLKDSIHLKEMKWLVDIIDNIDNKKCL